MRVVEVVAGAGWAGTERHVHGLLRGLASRGFQVELITSEDGALCDHARELGQPCHVVPRPSATRYLRSLTGRLREIRPDLVHAHSGRLACLAARRAGVPAIVETRHGLVERLSPLYRRLPLLRVYEGWKCRLADRTVVVCQADAEWLVGGARLDARRVHVIPNGLTPGAVAGDRREIRRSWSLPEEGPLAGFVGRLSREKAPERFLRLIHRLRGPAGWRGVICGSGSKEPELRSLADALCLSGSLCWTGSRPGAETLVGALDLLCIPSRTEGIPYVLLEGLAAGTPILATPVGGVPEVLTGEILGLGCRDWDVEDWGARAESFRSSTETRARWSDAARRRIRDFPEESSIDRIARLYAELGRGGRGSELSPASGRC